MKRCASSLMLLGLIVTLFGCGGGGGPDLVAVTGVVKYNGNPVPDASVAFQPETGPVAVGTTDASGKFTLSTNNEAGAVVGPGVFTVRAVENTGAPPAAPEETDKPEIAGAGNIDQMMQNADTEPPKSLIPEKYNVAASSDLKFTVDADASKNDFTLELKD